jgi:iron complex outermembrane receptor protein
MSDRRKFLKLAAIGAPAIMLGNTGLLAHDVAREDAALSSPQIKAGHTACNFSYRSRSLEIKAVVLLYALVCMMPIQAWSREGAPFQNQVGPSPSVQPPSAEPPFVGSVLDPHGLRVPGAEILLKSLSGGPQYRLRSDATGTFRLSTFAAGAYALTVHAPGFAEFTQTVNLPVRTDEPLVVSLSPATVRSAVIVTAEDRSLTTPTVTIGSLGTIPAMDLPQTVEVANRALLDEQKTYQYADSLTYLSGVQRAYTTIEGRIGNEVAMRGFNLDYNNNYLRDGYKFYGLGTTDTADMESVEVLKGPASALYGTAEAGGVVNLVSKKPTDNLYTALSMTGGSYQFLRPDFDLSGPLNHSRTLLFRLNGVIEDADSFRDYVNHNERFIAPYVLWKIGKATTLAAQGEIINSNRVSDYGLALFGDRPAPVSVSTSYTEPWNNEVDRDRQFGYSFQHDFHGGWRLTNGFQLASTNASYLEVYTNGPDTDPTQLSRTSDAFAFPTLYRYSRSLLAGTVRKGSVSNHLVIGLEAGWVEQSSLGPGGYAPDVSILHPATGSDFSRADAVAALTDPFFTLTYKSLYHTQSGILQDQVDLGSHWKAIAGLRVENYYQKSIDLSDNSSQSQNDLPLSPRAGLVYRPIESLSLYGSYVRSFIPTSPSAISASGNQFSPEHDHQWETGIKFAPFAERLVATLALYQIQKNNVLAPDPLNTVFSVQNGEERSKGVEFQLTGSPTPGLNLLSSYAFTQAQVTKSTEYPVGNLLPNAARHIGSLWANWQAPSGLFQHLGLSGGLLANSFREDNFYATAQLPGYARWDAGAYYEFGVRRSADPRQRLRFTINAQNLADRRYFLASNGLNQIWPGSPRSIISGVTWTWR